MAEGYCAVCGKDSFCPAEMSVCDRCMEVFTIHAAILKLTAEEASAVTICNPNPEFGGPNNVIQCHAEWTGWKDVSFYGETLLECLIAAVEAKEAASR